MWSFRVNDMKFWDYKNIEKSKYGNISQLGGTRRYVFADGKAKGVEAVEIRTGAGLQFTVLPGRGMDIAWTEYRGVPLNYMSKTGVVAPEHYESEGMNWLHNFFAGMLTTCGLLNVGGPEKVEHKVIGEREYGLHGRISNCAAEQVSIFEDWQDGEYVMKVSGLMREAVLHGEHLTLRREISTTLGSREFLLRDTVSNLNSTPQDIMLLYHINAGYPLLDKGSRFLSSSEKIIPQSPEAEKDMDYYSQCSEPIPNMTERCYAHDMKADEDGMVRVAFINDRLELGLALEYRKESLPCFNQWKMLNEKEYVVGLEPGNCLPCGYSAAKERGEIQTLMPEEQKTYEILFKVLDGKDEISQYEATYF